MITEEQKNITYFSKLLTTEKKYASAWERLRPLLEKHKLPYRLLHGTKDIWCRDYMPVQVRSDKYVSFKYRPSYLSDYPHLRSIPKKVCEDNGIEAVSSSINLDGGNVVQSNDKVIISKRIFSENPRYTDKNKLLSDLEKLLEAEVILIKDIDSRWDMTGHADGYVRFVNNKTLLGNARDYKFKYWTKDINSVIKKHGFDYIDMPYFEYKQKSPDGDDSAIGCYVNYLETKDVIFFPVFEVKGNKDREAVSIISKAFPEKIIEPVNINEVVLYGGLLNCITWTV